MRIAFLITRADDIGGAQIHVRDLANALASQGHAVWVISGTSGQLDPQLSDRVRFATVPLLRRAPSAFDLRVVWELRRLIRSVEPDLVSLHSSKAGILGRFAAAGSRAKVVFTAHGWAFAAGAPLHRRLYAWALEAAAAPLADAIITVSKYDEGLGRRFLPHVRGRIEHIPNAVHDTGFPLANASKQPPTLVSVARFDHQKDHRLLIDALASLQDLDWRAVLVGEGPTRSDVEAHTARQGLSGRIEFWGYRSDVDELLRGSSLFMLASRWEGMPRSIIEAMRAGLPVAATAVGGVPELVADGSSGLLTPPGNAEAFATALRELARDPQLRQRMGDEGRRRFETYHSFEALLTRTQRVYERLTSV